MRSSVRTANRWISTCAAYTSIQMNCSRSLPKVTCPVQNGGLGNIKNRLTRQADNTAKIADPGGLFFLLIFISRAILFHLSLKGIKKIIMTITILKNATIIDGTGNKPIERGLVVLQNEQIVYVGKPEGWKRPDDKSIIEIDLSDRTILPGLIDCHVHIAAECLPDSTLNGPWGWTSLVMLKHAQNTLAAGITTIRDVGGRHHLEFSLRKAIEAVMFAMPRISLRG